MANYTAHNRTIISTGLRNFAEREIKAKLIVMLRGVAQTLVDIIDGSFVMPNGTTAFPVYTANLHDATGVGVYSDGKLESFIPAKRASKNQSMGAIHGIDGTQYLQAALSNASGQFASGIWIVLFSTVPYAMKIQTSGSKTGRGQGFFTSLSDNLLKEVLTNLKPIAQ